MNEAIRLAIVTRQEATSLHHDESFYEPEDFRCDERFSISPYQQLAFVSSKPSLFQKYLFDFVPLASRTKAPALSLNLHFDDGCRSVYLHSVHNDVWRDLSLAHVVKGRTRLSS